jgi:hypothetical protein
MSTTGFTSWAVDLKDMAAVYPFQGLEVPMVIAAFAFWIIWHIIQMWQEGREYKEDKTAHFNSQNVNSTVERY